MLQDLINTQVCCYKDGNISEMALDCLRFMYPHFKVVKTEFDIYPGEPFIYIGDIRWLYKIQKRPEPHIIVASTGEYNLTDKETLMYLAYKKFNKTVPKYIIGDGIKDKKNPTLLETWSDDQFLYNWKYVWITGSPADKEQEKVNIYADMLANLSSPVPLTKLYVKALSIYGDSYTAFLDSAFISFIKKSRNITTENTKSSKMVELRRQFISSFDCNTSNAISNLISSPIDNRSLKFLDFFLDLVWPRRGDNSGINRN